MSLSNRQSARLGTLIAAMSRSPIPEPYLSESIAEGLISRLYNGNIILTDKGLDEKNRLCTLAGLNIKYLSELRSDAKSAN
jgi:hypothetical protein